MQVLCQKLRIEQQIKTKSLILQSLDCKTQTDRQTDSHYTGAWLLLLSYEGKTLELPFIFSWHFHLPDNSKLGIF